MKTGTQETSTEAKALTISDENISQADYEILRSGGKLEAKESAPADEAASETTDESDTSETEEQGSDEVSDSDADADDTLDTEKPKKKSGTQRRIEKLVKERTAERQAREQLEREREALRAELAASKGNPEAKPNTQSGDDPEPVDTDFETYNDYVKELTRWNVRQQRKAEKAEDEKRSFETKAQEKVKSHNEKMDLYKKENPDFVEHYTNFVADHPDFDSTFSNSLKYSIAESDVGPKLLHELLKDPNEFIRINSLDEFSLARAIGRLEAKLSMTSEETKKPEIKTKNTTKAPPPARPVSASSANGKKTIYDDDLEQADYERMRAEQERRRRGA